MATNEYNLLLDDVRSLKDVMAYTKFPKNIANNWKMAINYDEFVDTIKTHGMPKYISFDHDLSFEMYPKTEEDLYKPIDYSKHIEKSGYECAKWLILYCLDNDCELPLYGVHSMNPVGKANIFQLLNKYEFREK